MDIHTHLRYGHPHISYIDRHPRTCTCIHTLEPPSPRSPSLQDDPRAGRERCDPPRQVHHHQAADQAARGLPGCQGAAPRHGGDEAEGGGEEGRRRGGERGGSGGSSRAGDGVDA